MRSRFPILSRLTYLNSCSHGALSNDVREAYEQYLRDWETLGSPWELWGEKTDEARAAFAGLVGAEPQDVAVTTSLSAGVSALASGLRFDGPRSKIVLSEVEFPTSGSDLARAGGPRRPCRPHARLRIRDRRGDAARLADPRELLHGRATSGRGDHSACARARRARLPRRVPVRGDNPTRRPHTRRRLPRGGDSQVPPRLGGARLLLRAPLAGRERSPHDDGLVRRRGRLRDGRPRLLACAHRSSLPGGHAADSERLRRARRPSPGARGRCKRTNARVRELTQALADGTSRRVVTPEQRGALLCVEFDDPAAAVPRLEEQGVVTSWRDKSVRFSFHFYNDERDVEAALAALERI